MYFYSFYIWYYNFAFKIQEIIENFKYSENIVVKTLGTIAILPSKH